MTKLSDAVSASNLDSYELARRSNVSEKRLNGYLSGRHSFSRAPLEDAVAIANALGGRIEDYMEDAAEDGEAEKLDDRLRLQLFLDSVDEYELIMKNVGRPQTVTIGGSGEKTEKRYSQLIVEGMLLRKYYSSDEVQLAKVIDSFRRLIPDDASPDVLHTVDLLKKIRLAKGIRARLCFLMLMVVTPAVWIYFLMFSMELPCMEILIGSRDLLDGQLRHSALPYMSLTLRDARVW